MNVSHGRVPVEGSERPAPDGVDLGPVAPTETVSVTVVLQAAGPRLREHVESLAAQPPGKRAHLTRSELREEFGASSADVELVRRFASEHRLTVDRVNQGARTIELVGTAGQMAEAFSVDLRSYATAAGTVRGRHGTLYVPDWLAPRVAGVLGLDTRSQATPHFRLAPTSDGSAVRRAAAATQSYTPLDLAAVDEFPAGSGAGQTIALVELGGGFRRADLAHYFAGLGISPAPDVTAVVVDGAGNAPSGDPGSADGEVVLDVEVAGAIAPAAQIESWCSAGARRP